MTAMYSADWRITPELTNCFALWLPAGLPETAEANNQPNQRLPSTSSDTRQLSLESLESEPEVGSIATVPAITVTEASEESNEQNVPVSKAHPESLETEVAELLGEVETPKEGGEAGDQEAEGKERLIYTGLMLVS